MPGAGRAPIRITRRRGPWPGTLLLSTSSRPCTREGRRDPLIISWPRGISGGGGIRWQFHHVNDITPTLLDLIGIAEPAEVDGVAQQRVDGISMRYTFDDPHAPTRKGPQYFGYGNRGIWANGWMAVTVHNAQPWNFFKLRPVTDDVWELYHLSEDFNELHDLAASNAQKLQELRALFDLEARRNNVYPILPDFISSRREAQLALLDAHHGDFEFFGSERRIPEALAPPILHRAFSITAQIESVGAPANGAIVAQGGDMGGYALFAIDGNPRSATTTSASSAIASDRRKNCPWEPRRCALSSAAPARTPAMAGC